MKSLGFLTLCLAMLVSVNVLGQCDCPVERDNGWCWGSDPGATKEKQALIQDNVNNNNFEGALPAVEWAMENAPSMHVSLYKWGEKVYSGLWRAEKDKEKKKEIILKLMNVYDKRVECFGDKCNVINRKGLYAVAQGCSTKECYEELYNLYKEIYECNQEKTYVANIGYFVQIMGVRKKVMKDAYTPEQIMADYDMVTALITKILPNASEKDKEKLTKFQDEYDNALCSWIECDCNFAKETLWPKLREDESDLPLAAKIERFMREDCKTDPIYLEVLLTLWESDAYKTWKIAKSLSVLNKLKAAKANEAGEPHVAKQARDEAYKWLNTAIEMAELDENADQAVIAELWLEKGEIVMGEGKYTEARALFRKVAKSSPDLASKSYTNIAKMYMSSGSKCTGDPVMGTACYLAAYDMYQRAGNSAGMKSAQQYFPAIDKIFMLNYKEGQTIDVGCWIGGTTTIRKRP